VSLVCVTDYGVIREVLDGEEDPPGGRVLGAAQPRDPGRGGALGRRVIRADVDYLDGTIFSYPTAVATDDLQIMCAGGARPAECRIGHPARMARGASEPRECAAIVSCP
jgi:hypothetical protein